MKDEELDRFKKALRKKIEDRPINSENDAELWRKVLQEVRPDVKTIYKTEYPWYAVAAAALLFICFGLGLFLYNNKAEDNAISEVSIIGKANSPEKYDLTEEEINSVYGNIEPLEEKKSENHHFTNAIHNDKKVLRHQLTDGSVVTINAGSTVKIDESFENQRNLMLEGEAYFEVQPDKKKPFTVYFSDFKLVVVGTKFNIRNIANEKTKEITVTEGIVRVFDNNTSEGLEVKRGEQLKFSKDSQVLLKVETANYIAWKTGNLDFKKARLGEVATLLSRKFGKEIILTNKIKNCKFTGDLSGLTLEQSLEIISSSTSLKVENLNNKLYVTGSGCD